LTFSVDHISAPKGGGCTAKFLHELENDQGLLVHIALATGAPTFFCKGGKNGLKFCELAAITLEAGGVA